MKFFKNYFNYKVLYLLKKFKFKSPLLEIGCGIGDTLELLKDYEAEGIDFSADAVKICKEKDLKVRKTDFYSVKKKYGSIICLDVVEHVKDDLRFIKHIKKSLKPSGEVLILVPSGRRMNDDIKYGHYRRYSKNQIKELLEKANLSVIYEEMFGFPFFYYMRVVVNCLMSKAVEKENFVVNTKKSSYSSLFDKSLLSKIANFLNNSRMFLNILKIQDLFSGGNKGLGVIIISKNV